MFSIGTRSPPALRCPGSCPFSASGTLSCVAQPGGHAPLQPDVTARANPPKTSGAMTQRWNNTYNQLAPSLGMFTCLEDLTQPLQKVPTRQQSWGGLGGGNLHS